MMPPYHLESISKRNKIVPFRLPYQPYACEQSGAAIEVPWALSCLEEHDTVLDIGWAHATDAYLKELCNLNLKELHGVDGASRQSDAPGMNGRQADIGCIECYSPWYFDAILCVSVLQHIGFDASYLPAGYPFHRSENEDLVVIDQLERLLKQGGKLIITLPYGRYSEYGQCVVYDRHRLERLIEHSNLSIDRIDFFAFRNRGWYESNSKELEEAGAGMQGVQTATGLVCLLMMN